MLLFMKTLTLMNRSFESKMLREKLERASSIPAKFMGMPLSHSPPLLNQMHISPLELLHRVPLLDFDLLPGNCSSMAASSLLSLPNVVISQTWICL
ncbi:BnaCnng65280D [Brassica napus]|uniref:BnaCnng65280D protein n=1 Tax=Brassica napus TaxID=3708 RepID=A0A078JWB1_BRANA|nr:BnaCnng65280D [Brassica napus]